MMFFDWEMWGKVLTDPVSWGLILSLVIMEGLLSADNALVLAVLVKHLPEKQQKKALMYGLVGAYVFRFIAIGIGTLLIKFWFVKVLGSLYLMWIVFKFFKEKHEAKQAGDDSEETQDRIRKEGLMVRIFGTFWATVISVEIMDISFSVDSILAAFAISSEVWVLLLGGMLGILMMRMVAGVFLKLLEAVPEMEYTAFILIAIIAVKMALTVVDIHISHYAFFGILIVAFGLTFVVHKRNVSKAAKEEAATTK